MKVLFFVDIHANKKYVNEIVNKSKDADLLICAGDLSSMGQGFGEAAQILDEIGKPILIIPGNNETPDFVKSAVNDLKNFIYLEQEIYEDQGIRFLGLGSCMPSPWNTPYELTDEQMWNLLKKFNDKRIDILISHNPPKNTVLDQLPNGMNIGSFSVGKWIKDNQPAYCCCGHVHENAGKKTKIGRTLVFNPGPKGKIINIIK